ncbi:hypothetical protein D1007_06811 [Hordeum vulgare]|nr:hypothetical protein D1007_06811 [Hordeum vulgare]
MTCPTTCSEEPLGLYTKHMMVTFDTLSFEVDSHVDSMCLEARLWSLWPGGSFLSFTVSLAHPMPSLEEPLGLNAPNILVKPVIEGEKNYRLRSGRLEKKNKACNIPTSKCVEYRMLEAFDELSEVSKAEGPKQKMQAYPNMYKKPLSP